MHETAAHCPNCGADQHAAIAPRATKEVALPHTPVLMGMAVVGMFLGIFPFMAFFSTPDWTLSHARGSAIFATAALVLGCISTAKQHRARGMGIAAVVLGVTGLIMAFISAQPD